MLWKDWIIGNSQQNVINRTEVSKVQSKRLKRSRYYTVQDVETVKSLNHLPPLPLIALVTNSAEHTSRPLVITIFLRSLFSVLTITTLPLFPA